MPQPLRIAVIGTGRMGAVHALHAHELATETNDCRLVALVDNDLDRARRVAGDLGSEVEVFSSISELIRSGVSEAAVVVTPTASHRQQASHLVEAGHRFLLEKPLTGTIDSDREFSAQLDRFYLNALMLAFRAALMRRCSMSSNSWKAVSLDASSKSTRRSRIPIPLRIGIRVMASWR